MPKFRKRPIVVEAEQFIISNPKLPFEDRSACYWTGIRWCVKTAHGQPATIVDGDWIIAEPDDRGFYPCKNDIFLRIYEPLKEDTI